MNNKLKTISNTEDKRTRNFGGHSSLANIHIRASDELFEERCDNKYPPSTIRGLMTITKLMKSMTPKQTPSISDYH